MDFRQCAWDVAASRPRMGVMGSFGVTTHRREAVALESGPHRFCKLEPFDCPCRTGCKGQGKRGERGGWMVYGWSGGRDDRLLLAAASLACADDRAAVHSFNVLPLPRTEDVMAGGNTSPDTA